MGTKTDHMADPEVLIPTVFFFFLVVLVRSTSNLILASDPDSPQGFGRTTLGHPKVGLTSEADTSVPKSEASPKNVYHFFGTDVSVPNASPILG